MVAQPILRGPVEVARALGGDLLRWLVSPEGDHPQAQLPARQFARGGTNVRPTAACA